MIICFRNALQQEKKTDRPPRELIPEDSKKSAGAAVLDVKQVNAVTRESGVTLTTLEQYFRKSELLQTPSVDQFMPQLKFSQLKKRGFCPIIFYGVTKLHYSLSWKTTQPIHKTMSKLILTDYINVANGGTNVETGNQSIRVMLS